MMAEITTHTWVADWCRKALGFNDVDDVASYVVSMAVSSSCAEGELAEYVGALTPASPAAVRSNPQGTVPAGRGPRASRRTRP